MPSEKKLPQQKMLFNQLDLSTMGSLHSWGKRWELRLDDHDDFATTTNDLYNNATQQSLTMVDESIINFELIETLICSILQLELKPPTKWWRCWKEKGEGLNIE
jgi:hypothetical protein